VDGEAFQRAAVEPAEMGVVEALLAIGVIGIAAIYNNGVGAPSSNGGWGDPVVAQLRAVKRVDDIQELLGQVIGRLFGQLDGDAIESTRDSPSHTGHSVGVATIGYSCPDNVFIVLMSSML